MKKLLTLHPTGKFKLNYKVGDGDVKAKKSGVFIAGCPLSDETVQLLKKLSCPSYNVKIRNLMEKKKTDIAKTKAYGINSVPTVVVDGKIIRPL